MGGVTARVPRGAGVPNRIVIRDRRRCVAEEQGVAEKFT